MSIHVLSRVWKLRLGSGTRKLVMLKLADNANDEGYCYPSIERIADECEISGRTLQRTIVDLERLGLLTVKQRFHRGCLTSNAYYLKVPQRGGDRESPPSRQLVTTGLSRRQDPGDTASPRTTSEPSEETSQQPSRRGDGELVLPSELNDRDRKFVHRLLASLSHDTAQEVIDEWSAYLRRRTIRSPIAYLTSLVKRARSGTFQPELAHERRMRTARSEWPS